jgi:signal transduction histidine kinase
MRIASIGRIFGRSGRLVFIVLLVDSLTSRHKRRLGILSERARDDPNRTGSGKTGPRAPAKQTMQRSSSKKERSRRRLYLTLLGILLIALLGIVIALSLWTYRDVRAQVERELDERLLAIGSVIAQGLADSEIPLAVDSDTPLPFGSIRAELDRIAAASDLGQIQVLDPQRRFVVGTRTTALFGRVDPLLSAQPEVAVALAGIPTSTPLYEAPELRGTFFKTGFVPIESEQGEILGVVAVEGGSGFFEILPSLRRTWGLTGMASIVIAVLLAVLLIYVFRALERYERGMRGTAALATAGQLAAVVAHEVRNPLAILQSRAERVQDELRSGGDPEKVAELLDAVPIEVRRMNRILTNYLSLARIGDTEGGCAVVPVVEETLELVEKDLARADIRSSIEVGDRDLRARVGPGPLRQACMNLLLNARDAMSEGGELTVRIRGQGRFVRIDVRDSGPGIDRKDLSRLFEPFYTTRPTGSGLGLAVVDSVVRASGGKVEVISEIGRGSCFTLLFPAEEKG